MQISDAVRQEDGQYHISTKLNPAHKLFEGHFPEQPILPGVVMMELIRQCAQNISNQKLKLKSASAVKFLSLIDPVKNPDLTVKIKMDQLEEDFKVKAVLNQDDKDCFKQQAVFEIG